MKQIYFSFLFLSATIGARSNNISPTSDKSQLALAQKQIERTEYFIRKKDNASAYMSPNRSNGLNAQYTANTMRITPQDAAQQWAFSLTIKEVAGYKPVAQPVVTMHENTVQFDHGHHFQVEYVNTEAGIQQHFTIPVTGSEVTVKLQPEEGWKTMYNSQTGLTFSNNSQQLTYNDLNVVDAKGKKLAAHFTVQHNQVAVTVDAKDAVAPLSMYMISGELHRTTAKSLLQPNVIGAQMGAAASKAGDINNDGLADIIISAPYYTNGESQEGAVFVFYGTSPNGINPNNFTRLEKNVADGHFGEYISGGGDLNGDGFDDIVVGAPYVSGAPGNGLGSVYIYYGSAAGINTTPEILHSYTPGDYYGISVAILKDVNYDGIDDLAIGASNANSGAGYVNLVYGSTWDLSSSFVDQITVSGSTGFGIRVTDGGDVDNNYGHELIVVSGETLYVYTCTQGYPALVQTIPTPQAGISFGCSVAGNGDVNGDGFDDIVVGAKDYMVNGLHVGGMYVYYGNPNGSGLPATPSVSIPALQYVVNYTEGLEFGAQVAFAGDIDNDGYDELVVSEPGWESEAAQENEGVVFLYYGITNPTWMPYAQLQVDQKNGMFGSAVAGVGDVNGDGYGDLLACAKLYDNTETDEGIGLIWLGGDYIAARVANPALDTPAVIKTKTSIKTYPNPVANNLSVQYEGLDAQSSTYIQLMNVNGSVVKTVQIGQIEKGTQNIGLSGLIPGTYFLTINNGGNVVKEKIVKQ